MAGQHEGYALGVDLGTSHTVAVLRWPDGRTRPLLVDGQPIIPSGVYADADGLLHAGRDAQRLARADPARYEPNPKRRIDEPDRRAGRPPGTRRPNCSPRRCARWPGPRSRRWGSCPRRC